MSPRREVREERKQNKYYDQHTKEMKELRSGKAVRMLRDWKWKPATVLVKTDESRSYILQTENGKKVLTK